MIKARPATEIFTLLPVIIDVFAVSKEALINSWCTD